MGECYVIYFLFDANNDTQVYCEVSNVKEDPAYLSHFIGCLGLDDSGLRDIEL